MHLFNETLGDSRTLIPETNDADLVQLRPKAPSKPPRTFASLDLATASRIEQEIDVQKSERASEIPKTSDPGEFRESILRGLRTNTNRSFERSGHISRETDASRRLCVKNHTEDTNFQFLGPYR